MLDQILARRNFDIPYLEFGGIRLIKKNEVFLVRMGPGGKISLLLGEKKKYIYSIRLSTCFIQ